MNSHYSSALIGRFAATSTLNVNSYTFSFSSVNIVANIGYFGFIAGQLDASNHLIVNVATGNFNLTSSYQFIGGLVGN